MTGLCPIMVPGVKPRALLFDLDDTLVSFSTGQERLWARVLEEHGPLLVDSQPHRELDELVRVLDESVGPTYWANEERAVRGRLELYRARREVLRLGLDALGWDVSSAAIERVADAYTDTKERAVAPLGDAIPVVHHLRNRGYALALLTNGGSEFQRRKIRRYELESLFDVILIEGEWGVGKPHPSVFREAMRRLNVAPGEAWMIGDNYEADVVGAANVGIRGVWLHHGRRLPDGPVTPLHTIGHVRELLSLLE
jgi:putative hydrolase of the HAD superfamily